MMKSLISVAFAIFTISIASRAQQAIRASKPNIIFIFADDLGYGDVGCYGQNKIETPNIDALSHAGLRFTQFYSGSTVCAPARTTFLTGLHTGHTPVRGNKGFEPEGQAPLPDSVANFARILQQNGYATAAFGKWGLGYITTSGDPNKQGFDHFYGYNCQSLAHNYYPDHLWSDHNRIDFAGNESNREHYSADMIHREALAYIRRSGGKPFFLYLPYTVPHGEVITPDDSVLHYYISKFNEQPVTRKRMYDGRELGPYPHASFAAMVSRLDRYVGEILEAVKEKGIAQNTLIIFTSDNGPHKEGGGDPDFFDSNGIYRGIKRDLYEGGIRVPFIACWPGKIHAGVTGQVGVLWDMFPTFLELAGISFKRDIDGLSLVPVLLAKGKQSQHEYLYWEFHENNGRQAVRWKNWKAVQLSVGKTPVPPIELYDLSKDPSERKDLSLQYPAIVARMKTMMKEAHRANPEWPLLANEWQH